MMLLPACSPGRYCRLLTGQHTWSRLPRARALVTVARMPPQNESTDINNRSFYSCDLFHAAGKTSSLILFAVKIHRQRPSKPCSHDQHQPIEQIFVAPSQQTQSTAVHLSPLSWIPRQPDNMPWWRLQWPMRDHASTKSKIAPAKPDSNGTPRNSSSVADEAIALVDLKAKEATFTTTGNPSRIVPNVHALLARGVRTLRMHRVTTQGRGVAR